MTGQDGLAWQVFRKGAADRLSKSLLFPSKLPVIGYRTFRIRYCRGQAVIDQGFEYTPPEECGSRHAGASRDACCRGFSMRQRELKAIGIDGRNRAGALQRAF